MFVYHAREILAKRWDEAERGEWRNKNNRTQSVKREERYLLGYVGSFRVPACGILLLPLHFVFSVATPPHKAPAERDIRGWGEVGKEKKIFGKEGIRRRGRKLRSKTKRARHKEEMKERRLFDRSELDQEKKEQGTADTSFIPSDLKLFHCQFLSTNSFLFFWQRSPNCCTIKL